ncbi:hypothetical protein [Streptomyces alfalfae]
MNAASEFPSDLINAERERQAAAAERAALARRLPWSVEPLDGFDDSQIWRPRSRPASPGWKADEAAEMAALHDRQIERSAYVSGHAYWQQFTGPDLVKARMALKQAAAAPPEEA